MAPRHFSRRGGEASRRGWSDFHSLFCRVGGGARSCYAKGMLDRDGGLPRHVSEKTITRELGAAARACAHRDSSAANMGGVEGGALWISSYGHVLSLGVVNRGLYLMWV